MNLRGTAVGGSLLLLVGAGPELVGCAASSKTPDTAGMKIVSSHLGFVATGSSNYAAVNCKANSIDSLIVDLARSAKKDKNGNPVPLTVGVTEHGDNKHRIPGMTNQFLGGVSIVGEAGKYTVVTSSDKPGQATSIDLTAGDVSNIIDVPGQDYSLLVEIYESQDAEGNRVPGHDGVRVSCDYNGLVVPTPVPFAPTT